MTWFYLLKFSELREPDFDRARDVKMSNLTLFHPEDAKATEREAKATADALDTAFRSRVKGVLAPGFTQEQARQNIVNVFKDGEKLLCELGIVVDAAYDFPG